MNNIFYDNLAILPIRSYMLLPEETDKQDIKDFKNNSIFIIFIYMLTTVLNFLTSNIDYINITLVPKLFATIVAYYINEIYIDPTFFIYNKYIINLLKYSSIFIFQNIIFKLIYPSYKILSKINAIKTLLYLFIFISLDIINDVVFDKYYNNNILRIIVSFIIVESLFKNKINKSDYLNIFFIILSYFTYINFIYKKTLK